MRNRFFILTVFLSLYANAASGKRSVLEGYVVSFDNKEVVVESGNQKIRVPREKYKNKVQAGEKIYIELETSELDQLKKVDSKKN